MSEEIGLIYLSLSQLLDDICVFLRDGVTKEAFSAETKKQAETLIRRSKTQLQQISNLTNGECYMPMENEQKKVEEEEEDDLIYMDAEDPPKEVPVENNSVCPFAGVSAKDLPLQDKYGFISLKTKLILRFEKWKKIFAAIHEDWFLIYYNDKESKPCYTYNLKMYRAKRLPTSKQKADDTSLFGLVHLETEQMLQFAAQTHKDMEQWITRINRYHQQDSRQLSIPKDSPKVETIPVEELTTQDEEDMEDEEHYDSVILRVDNNNKVEETYEDEEMYEVIGLPLPDITPPVPKPADISTLPKRRQLTPLPPLPVEESGSTDSMASYDNPLNYEHSNEQLDISETLSFSEESEEEDNYDVLVTNTNPKQNFQHQGNISIYPSVTVDKDDTSSLNAKSNKNALELIADANPKNEMPTPPKKKLFDKKTSPNSFNSPTKENQLASPMNMSVIEELKSMQSPIKDEVQFSPSNATEVFTETKLVDIPTKEIPSASPMNFSIMRQFKSTLSNTSSASFKRKSSEKPSTPPKLTSAASKKENQFPYKINSSIIPHKSPSPLKSPIRDALPVPLPTNDSPVSAAGKVAPAKPSIQPKPPSNIFTKDSQFSHQNNSSFIQQLNSSFTVKSTMRDEFPHTPHPIDSSAASPGKLNTQPSDTRENQLSKQMNSSVIQVKSSSPIKSPMSDALPPPPPEDFSVRLERGASTKSYRIRPSSMKDNQVKSAVKFPVRNGSPAPPSQSNSSIIEDNSLITNNQFTQSSNSSTKENHFQNQINSTSAKSSLKEEFLPPSNDSSVFPTRKNSQPKPPSALTKPKIDVKLIKSLPNNKTTKQVMKLAKEISMK